MTPESVPKPQVWKMKWALLKTESVTSVIEIVDLRPRMGRNGETEALMWSNWAFDQKAVKALIRGGVGRNHDRRWALEEAFFHDQMAASTRGSSLTESLQLGWCRWRAGSFPGGLTEAGHCIDIHSNQTASGVCLLGTFVSVAFIGIIIEFLVCVCVCFF